MREAYSVHAGAGQGLFGLCAERKVGQRLWNVSQAN